KAAFSEPEDMPAVLSTCCISDFVSPAAPLPVICNTLETLNGEMKTLASGWAWTTCRIKSKAKPTLADTSLSSSNGPATALCRLASVRKSENKKFRRRSEKEIRLMDDSSPGTV